MLTLLRSSTKLVHTVISIRKYLGDADKIWLRHGQNRDWNTTQDIIQFINCCIKYCTNHYEAIMPCLWRKIFSVYSLVYILYFFGGATKPLMQFKPNIRHRIIMNEEWHPITDTIHSSEPYNPFLRTIYINKWVVCSPDLSYTKPSSWSDLNQIWCGE